MIEKELTKIIKNALSGVKMFECVKDFDEAKRFATITKPNGIVVELYDGSKFEFEILRTRYPTR